MHRKSSWLALSLALVVTTQADAGTQGVSPHLATRLGEIAAAAADTRAPFRYSVSMADPQRHEFTVHLELRGLPGERVQLELPKWNPGSYRLTNAHRNLRGLRAAVLDGKQQKPIGISRIDENAWELVHDGAPLLVDYRIYCGSYSGIGGCFLDDEFGFINGVTVFMYAVGHKHRPIELSVSDLPGGKQAEIVTGMPSRKRAQFWASDYDVLVDSPIHAGKVETVSFELGGRPVRAVFSRPGTWKPDDVRDELSRITKAAAAVFGPLETAVPFTDYTFIFHVLPDNGAGLEHLNSTAIGVDPWMFADERGKQKFWSVSAHEFFHLWNVKRIRPAVLGPFDYDKEVHTTMLWFSEGFTSYYAILINTRAQLLDEHQARDELGKRIAAVEQKPGRKLLSVEQSSWDTWAPPDDRDKAYYSYYDKGAVLGMLFDLHLRHATEGKASTDSVFQALWKQWRETGLGLSPAQLEQAFVEQAGPGADELREMFEHYVRGTDDIDYDRYLAYAGYRLERRLEHPGPWIGATVERQREQLRVRMVEHDSPGDRGGLADGDVIQAIDGQRVAPDAYAKMLAALTIDKPHELTVERNSRVLTLSITPIEGGDTRYEIVELDEVTPEQLALRNAWLGLH